MDTATALEEAVDLAHRAVHRSSWFLSSLPPEVIGEIVTGLTGFDIVQLCFCGNIDLNKKLRQVVEKLEICVAFALRISSWRGLMDLLPRFSELFVNEFDYLWENINKDILSDMPMELRSLTMHYSQAALACCVALRTFRVVDHSQLREAEEGLKWIGSMPSLTDLHFFAYEAQYPGPLADLIPPNLTHLNITMRHCDDVYFDLPASLVKFEARILRGDVHDIEALPPHLTHFSFFHEDKKFTVDELALLPPSLTYLYAHLDLNSREVWTQLPLGLQALKSVCPLFDPPTGLISPNWTASRSSPTRMSNRFLLAS